MASFVDDIVSEVRTRPTETQTPRAVFEKFLPTDSGNTQATRESEYRHIRVVTNFEGHAVFATTRKVGNIRFNLKSAILDDVPGLIQTVGSIVAGSVIPLMIPIACLQTLRYLRNLSTIKLTETDALVLKRLFELGGEDRTVATANLEATGGLSHAAVKAAIPKLQELGCLSTVAGEVVLNETIEFCHDT
jgi:hypothetical protein